MSRDKGGEECPWELKAGLNQAGRIISEAPDLAGSELELERVSLRVRCLACGYEGPVSYLGDEGGT